MSEAEYGMLHLFTSHELKPVPFKSPEISFQLGPSSAVIQRGEIPELAWANYFSKELVQGADIAGLKADGFYVDDQSNDAVLLSLSDSVFDVKDDFLLFAEKRALAKKRFVSEFFGVGTSGS